jgi:hypothetical protein
LQTLPVCLWDVVLGQHTGHSDPIGQVAVSGFGEVTESIPTICFFKAKLTCLRVFMTNPPTNTPYTPPKVAPLPAAPSKSLGRKDQLPNVQRSEATTLAADTTTLTLGPTDTALIVLVVVCSLTYGIIRASRPGISRGMKSRRIFGVRHQIQIVGAHLRHFGVQIPVILDNTSMTMHWLLIRRFAVIWLVPRTRVWVVQALVNRQWQTRIISKVSPVILYFFLLFQPHASNRC